MLLSSTQSLLIFCLLDLSDRGVQQWIHLFSFAVLSVFCLMYVDNVLRHIHSKDCLYLLGVLTPFHYIMSLFFANNYLSLKSVLCEINIVTIAFFWLVFTLSVPLWQIYVSLYLKWVFCRQHIIESLLFDLFWHSLSSNWYI